MCLEEGVERQNPMGVMIYGYMRHPIWLQLINEYE